MKHTLIEPNDTRSDDVKAVIEFVPIVKRHVGIGYFAKSLAVASPSSTYPMVNRPWINPEKF
jgi:hypothetical protein